MGGNRLAEIPPSLWPIDKLIDYAKNTPEDGYRSFASVEKVNRLIDKNLPVIRGKGVQ